MNTHLGNSLTDGFAITEIPQRRAPKASQDSGLRLLVGQMGEPLIEVRRSQQRVQVFLVYPSGYIFATTQSLRYSAGGPLKPGFGLSGAFLQASFGANPLR